MPRQAWLEGSPSRRAVRWSVARMPRQAWLEGSPSRRAVRWSVARMPRQAWLEGSPSRRAVRWSVARMPRQAWLEGSPSGCSGGLRPSNPAAVHVPHAPEARGVSRGEYGPPLLKPGGFPQLTLRASRQSSFDRQRPPRPWRKPPGLRMRVVEPQAAYEHRSTRWAACHRTKPRSPHTIVGRDSRRRFGGPRLTSSKATP